LLGRVLVVEDDEGMREAFRDFFEDAGYVVRCAANGVEALAILRCEPISLIVLDLQMPGMDGRELRRRQREDPSIAGVPVVLVTANPRATIDGVRTIRKPFDGEALLRVVEALQGVGGAPGRDVAEGGSGD
jgi:CheY-like chemotaxis protein